MRIEPLETVAEIGCLIPGDVVKLHQEEKGWHRDLSRPQNAVYLGRDEFNSHQFGVPCAGDKPYFYIVTPRLSKSRIEANTLVVDVDNSATTSWSLIGSHRDRHYEVIERTGLFSSSHQTHYN